MNARSLARNGSRFAAIALALLAGVVGHGLHAARAEGIPSGPAMYYSGTLEENGVAVEGVRSMALRLYEGPESSRPVLCESVPPASGGVPGDVTVRGGRFRFEIGDDCVSAMRTHPNVLAELVVGGTPLPRAKVGAVPYAVEADHALRANEATHATNADTAANADMATNAAHATNADTATNAANATGGLDNRITTIEAPIPRTVRFPSGAATAASLSPLSTTTPGAQTMLMQAGTHALQANSNGDLTITYPSPFPNGVLSVVVSLGDTTGCAEPVAYAYQKDTVKVRVNANGLCRLNWVAVGW